MRPTFKVMSTFGTRPEAFMLAPVIQALEGDPFFESTVVVTGQHRQMRDGGLSIFGIVPDYDLNVMQPDQSLNSRTCRILQGPELILLKEKPECVLVQGDIFPAIAAVLCAFYLKIPVVHVEPGLRTSNRFNPFPEDINRRLTTSLSDLHFCPTGLVAESLRKEGVDTETIHSPQITVIGSLFYVPSKQRERPKSLSCIDLNKRILAVTMHRRENQGGRMGGFCKATLELCDNFTDIEVVIPLRLSPAVQTVVKYLWCNHENIQIVDPLDYLDFTCLSQHYYLVLTDSGGVQEETHSLGKPVLDIRDVTERPERVNAGVDFVSNCTEKIVELATSFLADDHCDSSVAKRVDLRGMVKHQGLSLAS